MADERPEEPHLFCFRPHDADPNVQVAQLGQFRIKHVEMSLSYERPT